MINLHMHTTYSDGDKKCKRDIKNVPRKIY